ncbi:MAG: SH3 domain-containing protein [Synergistaceae bacterium]|nr:SH3 domain-containing protein [Synergistaceae bacterium]
MKNRQAEKAVMKSRPQVRAISAALLLMGILFFFPVRGEALAGLEVSQSPLFHAASLPDVPLVSEERQHELFVEMREQFFSPWTQTEPRKATETLEWVFDRYGKGGIFGENLQPRPSSWVEEQLKASRIGAAGELNRFAVSVRQSSLRLMPTEEPAFFSPDLAGEGFPFDYLQNSLVHPGEPLFVSHLSEDGLRAWCDTSYASGWMNLHDLAFVDEKTVKYWMELPLAAVVSENTVFRWGEMSLFRAKTGALFPLVSRGITEHRVLVPFRGLDGHLVVKEVRASSEKVKPVPLPLTPWKLAVVAEEFTGELYGWGGYLGNRDCSAMTRDILLPFGIWLPRNSASQAGIGEVLSLENLSPAEKKDIIKSQGLPFLTLLGMPGHIMLYIGTCKGEPLVLHNMWGVRTERKGVEGRFIVGRCVLSTLDIGSDHPDHVPGRLLIDRLNRMAFPAARH